MARCLERVGRGFNTPTLADVGARCFVRCSRAGSAEFGATAPTRRPLWSTFRPASTGAGQDWELSWMAAPWAPRPEVHPGSVPRERPQVLSEDRLESRSEPDAPGSDLDEQRCHRRRLARRESRAVRLHQFSLNSELPLRSKLPDGPRCGLRAAPMRAPGQLLTNLGHVGGAGCSASWVGLWGGLWPAERA